MNYIWFHLLFQLGFIAANYFNSSMDECITGVPNFDDKILVLNTLNGKIKGSCYRIEINDTTSNTKLVDHIISWKSL